MKSTIYGEFAVRVYLLKRVWEHSRMCVIHLTDYRGMLKVSDGTYTMYVYAGDVGGLFATIYRVDLDGSLESLARATEQDVKTFIDMYFEEYVSDLIGR